MPASLLQEMMSHYKDTYTLVFAVRDCSIVMEGVLFTPSSPSITSILPEIEKNRKFVTPWQHACRWGVSILLSRLIRLQDGPLMEALVPWADFINHSTASGAYVRVSTGVTGQIDALTNRFTGFGDSLGGMLGQGGNDDPDVAVRCLHAMHVL